MMKLVARGFGRLMGVLLTTAAVVAVALFVLTATSTAHFIPVLSNSMAPDMPKGSLAVVTPIPAQDVAAGDVIVFTAPDGTRRRVIHRIEHRYGPDEADTIAGWTPDKLFLTTAGDNNPSPDPWILVLDEITLWHQHTVIPYVGWPLIGLSDPTTRMIAFGAGGAVIAAWALVHIWRRPTPTEPGSAPGSKPGTDASSSDGAPETTGALTDRTPRATTDTRT